MSGDTRLKLLVGIWILTAALTASHVGAQTSPAAQSTTPTPPPAPAAPLAPAVGQAPAPAASLPLTAAEETTKGTGCRTIPMPAGAGGASVIQATGESLQHKNWQPKGGEIQFTVKSFVVIPADASVIVCFRWKSASEKTEIFEARPTRLDRDSDGKLLKVTTTVPASLGPQPKDAESAVPLLPLVPIAEVRILAIDNTKTVKADVTTYMGITYPWLACVFALATMIIGFGALIIAGNWRLQHSGIMQANWLLRIVSTPSGFASLSQLQILVWTFVVAASAVYVMSLSGQLVEVTSGTLVLLGIAGAAGVAAKSHSEAQGATVEAEATKAANAKAAADIHAAESGATYRAAQAAGNPVEVARTAAESTAATTDAATKATMASVAKAKADAVKNPPATQIPKWSDLIVNERTSDGITTREIDVARFQMLLFTLITAAFVLVSVVTTYVIPEISSGFQTLMGISNGVYLGSKVVQKT